MAGRFTSDEKQMSAAAIGGGKFGDDWVKVEQFSKTTTVQYKDEVVGGTFAPSTPWKNNRALQRRFRFTDERRRSGQRRKQKRRASARLTPGWWIRCSCVRAR